MKPTDLAPTDYVYLATPYTKHPRGHAAAYADACFYAGELITAGFNVFSPIAHGHGLSVHAGIPATDHEVWMKIDRPMMAHAAALVIAPMDGWRESKGIAEEIKTFRAAGKPVLMLVLDNFAGAWLVEYVG